MENRPKNTKFIFSKTALVIVFCWIVYTVLTFMTPQTATGDENFAIGDTALLLIRLTIVLPYLALWLFAGGSVWYLRRVSSPALASFKKYFTLAISILLVGMIVTGFLSTYRGLLVNGESIIPLLTIVLNLLYVIFPLFAYYYMLLGLRETKSDKDHTDWLSKSHYIQAIVGTLVIAVPFVWFVFTNVNRMVPFAFDTPATYYLSDPLIFLLVIIPTTVGWVLGLLVAFKINDSFQELAERNIDLFNGIFLIVLSSIILQALISIGTLRLFQLGLGAILILIYIFIAIQLIGFKSLMKNVRKLQD